MHFLARLWRTLSWSGPSNWTTALPHPPFPYLFQCDNESKISSTLDNTNLSVYYAWDSQAMIQWSPNYPSSKNASSPANVKPEVTKMATWSNTDTSGAKDSVARVTEFDGAYYFPQDQLLGVTQVISPKILCARFAMLSFFFSQNSSVRRDLTNPEEYSLPQLRPWQFVLRPVRVIHWEPPFSMMLRP